MYVAIHLYDSAHTHTYHTNCVYACMHAGMHTLMPSGDEKPSEKKAMLASCRLSPYRLSLVFLVRALGG